MVIAICIGVGVAALAGGVYLTRWCLGLLGAPYVSWPTRCLVAVLSIGLTALGAGLLAVTTISAVAGRL